MRLFLTSFGITAPEVPAPLAPRSAVQFHRMPPVAMGDYSGGFRPNFGLLLAFDQIVLDTVTFSMLQDRRNDPAYGKVADTFLTLHREGFVELADYSAILSKNADLLGWMNRHDLGFDLNLGPFENADEQRWMELTTRHSIQQLWAETLTESAAIWRRFLDEIREGLQSDYESFEQGFAHSTTHGIASYASQEFSEWSWVARSHINPEDTDKAIGYRLKPYIEYVNANLVLSAELGMPFLDWEDFGPFYQRKFRSSGHREVPGMSKIEAADSLFNVSFPELAIDDVSELVRILQDRRVVELRALIEQASSGDVTFDAKFARSVFHEVIGRERALSRARRLVGYLTLPLDVLPFSGVVQTALQELADVALKKRYLGGYRWFYLLSDVAASRQR